MAEEPNISLILGEIRRHIIAPYNAAVRKAVAALGVRNMHTEGTAMYNKKDQAYESAIATMASIAANVNTLVVAAAQPHFTPRVPQQHTPMYNTMQRLMTLLETRKDLMIRQVRRDDTQGIDVYNTSGVEQARAIDQVLKGWPSIEDRAVILAWVVIPAPVKGNKHDDDGHSQGGDDDDEDNYHDDGFGINHRITTDAWGHREDGVIVHMPLGWTNYMSDDGINRDPDVDPMDTASWDWGMYDFDKLPLPSRDDCNYFRDNAYFHVRLTLHFGFLGEERDGINFWDNRTRGRAVVDYATDVTLTLQEVMQEGSSFTLTKQFLVYKAVQEWMSLYKNESQPVPRYLRRRDVDVSYSTRYRNNGVTMFGSIIHAWLSRADATDNALIRDNDLFSEQRDEPGTIANVTPPATLPPVEQGQLLAAWAAVYLAPTNLEYYYWPLATVELDDDFVTNDVGFHWIRRENLLLAQCAFQYRYWRILPIPPSLVPVHIMEQPIEDAAVGAHRRGLAVLNHIPAPVNPGIYRARFLSIQNSVLGNDGRLPNFMLPEVALGGEILHLPMAAARKLLYPTTLLGADLQAAVQDMNSSSNCVITYMLYELIQTANSRLKTMTRARLMREMTTAYAAAHGRVADEEEMMLDETGLTYTLAHVLAWVRTRQDVSVYALDFMWRPVAAHRAAAPRVYMFMLVNNGHCYGLLDTAARYAVSRRVTSHNVDEETGLVDASVRPLPTMKQIDIRTTDMRTVCTLDAPTYNDTMPMTYEEMEEEEGGDMVHNACRAPDEVVEDMKAQLFSAADECTASTIVIPVSNLQEYMLHVVAKCGVMPEHVGVRETHIYAFRHPTTGQLFLVGDDFEARKHVADGLHACYQLINFDWKNQSWAMLASSLMDVLTGSIPESSLSNEVATIFAQHPIRAYVWSSGAVTSVSTALHSIDTRRAYTSALLNDTTHWPVYDALDGPACRPLGTAWIADACGEAYVARAIMASRGCMVRPAGWYPMVWVRHALACQYITDTDITHVLEPRRCLPPSVFHPFVTAIRTTFPDESKYVVNALVGVWTGTCTSKTTIALTTELDVVTQVVGPRMDDTPDLPGTLAPRVTYSVFQVGDIHIVYEQTRTPKRSCHLPLARHVMASAWVHLDIIATTVVSPWATILGMKTDAVLFAGTFDHTAVRPKQDAQPGQYHLEGVPPGAAMFGSRTETLLLRAPPPYAPSPSIITHMYDDIPWHAVTGALVLGPPGSGKSHEIVHAVGRVEDPDHADSHLLHGKRAIVLSYTHAGCERIKADGARASTVKSIVFDAEKQRDDVYRLLAYEVVIVDEYTMLPPPLMGLLLLAKRLKPELILFLLGDANQCHAPVQDWTYYESSSAVLEACGNTVCELSYKGHRYDAPMHAALQRFCNDGILTTGWHLSSAGHAHEQFAITRTNAQRKCINATRWQQWLTMHAPAMVYQVDDLQYAIGCTLMCYDDTVKACQVFKTQRYVVSGVGATHVQLQRKHWDPSRPLEAVIEVPFAVLRLFTHAFAATVEKIQGVTLYEPYSVYEPYKMDRNLLYTALSRGRTLTQVCLVPPMGRGTWPRALPRSKILMTIPAPARSTAYVYTLTIENELGDTANELVASKCSDPASVQEAYNEQHATSSTSCVLSHTFEYVAPNKRPVNDMDILQDALTTLRAEGGEEHAVPTMATILVSDERLRLAPPDWRQHAFNILHDSSKRRYVIRCRQSAAPIHVRFTYTDAASQEAAYAAAIIKRDELRSVL